MQRIETLLEKISELASKGDKNSVIDIDLMMDYAKVMYADMLEWRNRVAFTDSLAPTAPVKDAQAAEREIVETPSQSEHVKPQPIEPVSLVAEMEEEEEVAEEEAIAESETKQEVIEEPTPEIPRYNFPEKKDIRNVIGINDKYQFISELFGGDNETYEKTLDELSTFSSYDEAYDWLKENVLFVDDSEEITDTIQTFYDTLNTFFSDK